VAELMTLHDSAITGSMEIEKRISADVFRLGAMEQFTQGRTPYTQPATMTREAISPSQAFELNCVPHVTLVAQSLQNFAFLSVDRAK
jgi:hypothetical protein